MIAESKKKKSSNCRRSYMNLTFSLLHPPTPVDSSFHIGVFGLYQKSLSAMIMRLQNNYLLTYFLMWLCLGKVQNWKYRHCMLCFPMSIIILFVFQVSAEIWCRKYDRIGLRDSWVNLNHNFFNIRKVVFLCFTHLQGVHQLLRILIFGN